MSSLLLTLQALSAEGGERVLAIADADAICVSPAANAFSQVFTGAAFSFQISVDIPYVLEQWIFIDFPQGAPYNIVWIYSIALQGRILIKLGGSAGPDVSLYGHIETAKVLKTAACRQGSMWQPVIPVVDTVYLQEPSFEFLYFIPCEALIGKL